MKKLFAIALMTIVLQITFGTAAAQVESLIQGATGPGGKVTGTFGYFATGTTEEPVTYETQALSKYSLNGEFPKIVIYKAGAGAGEYESETLIQMQQGHMSTLEKVGSSILVTFVDGDNQNQINGVLVQSAAGSATNILGQGEYSSIFKTAGGLQMATQLQFIGESGKYNVGAIRQVTEGYGPAAGQIGETGSQITVRWEEHVSFGGFKPGGAIPYSGMYSVSMNPSMSLLPKTP